MPDENGNATPEEILAQALADEEREREEEAARLEQERQRANQPPPQPTPPPAAPTTLDIVEHLSIVDGAMKIIEGEVGKNFELDPDVMANIRKDILRFSPAQIAEAAKQGKDGPLSAWINMSKGMLDTAGKRKEAPKIAEASSGAGTGTASVNKDLEDLKERYGAKTVKTVIAELKEINSGRNPSQKQLEEALRRIR